MEDIIELKKKVVGNHLEVINQFNQNKLKKDMQEEKKHNRNQNKKKKLNRFKKSKNDIQALIYKYNFNNNILTLIGLEIN